MIKIPEISYFCKICRESLVITPSKGVGPLKTHIESAKHQHNLNLLSRNEELSEQKFETDFLLWMLRNDIPLSELRNNDFTSFLNARFTYRVKYETNYRDRVLPRIFEEKRTNFISKIQSKPFYISFDSTSDCNGKKILHILGGEILEVTSEKPFLLRTV